jgi:drug/metabolite transporter (DMT)-like permease
MPTLAQLARSAAPPLVLLFCFAVFSGYTVLTKTAIKSGASPTVLCFLRECVATCALLPAAYLTQRRTGGRFWPAREHAGDFVILGSVMVYGVQMLSALAISRLSPINYALWAPLVPVATLFIALLTGYEYFHRGASSSWLKVAGIGVAVVGAIVVATGAAEHSGSAKEFQAVVTGNVRAGGRGARVGGPSHGRRATVAWTPSART